MVWILDNWVVMALAAAAAWALSSVVDVCFVSNGIYKKASEGALISGLFCAIPATASTAAIDLNGVSILTISMGVLSGVAYLLHVYFYFQALFKLNDAVNAEVFNSLSVVVVPILAILLLGERLAWSNYLAIAVTALAIIVLVGFQTSRLSWSALANLVASVLSISTMMVSQAWVLERVDYATAVWMYSSTAFATAVVICGIRQRNRRRISQMFRQFGPVFVAVEMLEILAVLSSQRATDKGPSVSLVALLECALPIFIMLFSYAIAGGSKLLMPSHHANLSNALSLQTIAAPAKILSLILIACAIFIVQ